jgi:hypothetical protein
MLFANPANLALCSATFGGFLLTSVPHPARRTRRAHAFPFIASSRNSQLAVLQLGDVYQPKKGGPCIRNHPKGNLELMQLNSIEMNTCAKRGEGVDRRF